ncbi:CHAP domain-containing protein [Saccharothrix sp. NRRL B-16348]|uniref:CHAP domain-containing protein n=1 Tax=Saccharothrix sp. NRRL B-16348 TaxID=1415542 RepID=UPI0006AEDC8B|nr:CHAP domain-containing protein [Saccharothrix sp. NRRL B-16348]
MAALATAVAVALATLVASPGSAWAGVDDYPAEWRNAAMDSRVDSWGYYNRECTSFVAWRLHARNGFEMPRAIGNAGGWGTWFAARGYAVNGTPAVGSIAESSGHVAWVEGVHGDGTVTIEEYNYNYQGTYRQRRVAASTFRYIHVKDITSGGLSDGTFVRDADTGAVYRIAGGAPLYVSTWSAFGGSQPSMNLSHAAVLALPQYPRDGTFVVGTARGEVYRFAGGAPLYVSTWSAFGGSQPTVAVDQAAIDNAGAGDVWDHVRYHPADGTFVTGTARGEVYRFAGGAPVYVSTWDRFGGPQTTVAVDQAALDNAGAGSVWNHARYHPADGTFVVGTARGEVYRFAGGAPLYVSAWDRFGGPQPTVGVDDAALDNAGAGSVWNHIRSHPADGTLVNGSPRGEVYRFAGGAPLYISTWDAIGGPQPSVTVDQAALDNAGAGSVWDHARYHPADGTLLSTHDDRVWQVIDRAARHVLSWDEVGGPRPTVRIDLAAIQNAGLPGVWSHLTGHIS